MIRHKHLQNNQFVIILFSVLQRINDYKNQWLQKSVIVRKV